MANQQLVDYIRAQESLGVTKDALAKAVVTAGWPEADIADAFAVVEGKAAPAPAPVTTTKTHGSSSVVLLSIFIALLILILVAEATLIMVPAVRPLIHAAMPFIP
jgi:hypothetical protein